MVAINTTTMTTIGSELSTWLWLNVGVLGQTRSSQAIGSFIGYCTCCILRFVCYEVSNAARINKPLTCLLWSWVSLLSVPGKVLTRILLDRVRQKLLTHQRHEQSGFTPKMSTEDRILALRILTERLHSGGLPHSAAGSLCVSPQGVRLGEPRCTLENPGPPRNTPKARQPDIRPVFWYKECCKV